MGLPKSVRFDIMLEKKIEKYIDANGIRFSQLLSLAVEKFISEPQSIKLIPVDTKDFLSVAKKASRKHKDALEKLK